MPAPARMIWPSGAVRRLLLVREAPAPERAAAPASTPLGRPRGRAASCRSRPGRGPSQVRLAAPRRPAPTPRDEHAAPASRPDERRAGTGRLPGASTALAPTTRGPARVLPFASIGSEVPRTERVPRQPEVSSRRSRARAAPRSADARRCSRRRRSRAARPEPASSVTTASPVQTPLAPRGRDLVPAFSSWIPSRIDERRRGRRVRRRRPRERRAEDRHHRVADVLLDDAAVRSIRSRRLEVSWFRSRTSSGSAPSARAVDPTMSTNRTETSLRSSCLWRAELGAA